VRLSENLKRLERELAQARARIAEMQIEIEAHEGLLRLSMEDMRRIYDDLLQTHVRLLQADKMATIGILTAGIVHEIKNPLSYVQGNVWLLSEALKGVERLAS
jgi:C4-dicarboxylate-specific signal transduction histidine kinase